MMANAMALGHSISELTDGVTVFRGGEAKPMPLLTTNFDISIKAGLAIIVTTRKFANEEDVPIEAVMTMPVAFDAVVTGLSAEIDGRRLSAVAQPREAARETYEEAIDRGKMAVLHEEALRGIHVLSIGQLPPGKAVAVELRTVQALTTIGADQFLRVPVTAGQLYGNSPLQPADDLITGADFQHIAKFRLSLDEGDAALGGHGSIVGNESVELVLDRAIEIRVNGGHFGTCHGLASDGRQVRLDLKPLADGNLPLARISHQRCRPLRRRGRDGGGLRG